MIKRFLILYILLFVFAFSHTGKVQAALFAESLAFGEGVQYAGIVFLGSNGSKNNSTTASVCDPALFTKFCKENGQVGVGESCEGKYKSCACEEKYTHCECWPDHRADTCTVDGYTYYDKCKPCSTCSAKIYPYNHENCTINGELSGEYCTDAAGMMHYKECRCKPEYKICPCGASPRAKKCERDVVAKWNLCQACNKCPFEEYPYTVDNCLAPRVLDGPCTEKDGSVKYKSCQCGSEYTEECPCGGAIGATSCTADGVTKWTACRACSQDCSGFKYNRNNCLNPAVLGGTSCNDGNMTWWQTCSCPASYAYDIGNCPTNALKSPTCHDSSGQHFADCKCSDNYRYPNKSPCAVPKQVGGSSCTDKDGTNWTSCGCPSEYGSVCSSSGGLTGVGDACDNLYKSCKCNSSYIICSNGPKIGASAPCTADGGNKYPASDCLAGCSGYQTCSGTGVEGVSACSTDSTKFLSCRCNSSYITCPSGTSPESGASACTADGGNKYLASNCKVATVDCSGYKTCSGTGVEGVTQCPTNSTKFLSCRCNSSYMTCSNGPKTGASAPCTADGGNKYLSNDCKAETVDCSSYKTCSGTGVEGVTQCPTDSTKFVSCRCKSTYQTCPNGTVPRSGALACTADGGNKYLSNDCVVDCSSYKTCSGTGVEGVSQCPTDSTKFQSCRCQSAYQTCPNGPKSGASAPCTADGGNKYLASDCEPSGGGGTECTPSATIICTDLDIVYNNGDVLPYIDTTRKTEIWGIKSGGIAIKKTSNGTMRWSEGYDAAAVDGGFMPSVSEFEKLHNESSAFNATVTKLKPYTSANPWENRFYLTRDDRSGSNMMSATYNGCYNSWEGCPGTAFCAIGTGSTKEQYQTIYCRHCGPDWGYKCLIRRYNVITGEDTGCNKWTPSWTLRIARSA